GTFTDITRAARVGDCGNGNAAVFVDYDLDGDLDVLVGNYFRRVDLWRLPTTRIMHDSFEASRNAGPNILYRNNGDGTFTDVAPRLGLDDTGWTLDLGCADIDNDGDQDCYIANDFGNDSLFRNEGDGTFRNVTAAAKGIDNEKGMNVDFGDFNNDGFLDIYVTNITTVEYLREGNMLWHNMGDGSFTDVAGPSEVYDGGWGWAGKFLDYDNDGDLDIFTVNGFVSAGEGNYWYDLATMATTPDLDITDTRNWPTMGDRSFSGHEPSRLFRNDGPVFVEVAAREGITDTRDGRGIAVADFDGDGWLDLFVANQGAEPNLYRNRGRRGRHWIAFDLRQEGANTTAIGARLTVRSGDLTQIREVDGGNGYASQSSTRLHFGLGGRPRADEVTVRWPGGRTERLHDLKADRVVRLRPGGEAR
ncbi:MAG: CRTAC1 family protein, partial [Acidobacteria bacterium]|nr:CRTAC1 family protein [Acidobacteriota bacterium]